MRVHKRFTDGAMIFGVVSSHMMMFAGGLCAGLHGGVRVCIWGGYIALLLAIGLPLPATADDGARHVLTYSVSERAVTVVSAVTPYDPDPEVRGAFLRWFKRGFDSVLAGEPPLMIEWDTNAKGRAGRRGYDFGLEEAERFTKRKPHRREPHTIPIPPA